MQKMVKVQKPSGEIEDVPEFMITTKFLKKHGWRIVQIPQTVEELKAEVESLKEEPVIKRGRPKKVED